jgi:hypothetical protein
MNNNNNTSNIRTPSAKDEFIFNLNISSKYKEDLVDIPKFIIIYDYYLISSKLFLEFKQNILSRLFQNLKIEKIISLQIHQQKYLKTFETNNFLSSDIINLFQLNIKDIFTQLEELFKKNKSRFFNILVISYGNFEKTDDSYINEVMSKILKKTKINLKIVKLSENNNSYLNYFLKLNTHKDDENNKIIELTGKADENIYKELYDFYNHKNLESGWKIVRSGNKIIKIPINSTKDIENSNEDIFFENFNLFISSLSQRVAINKTISNQFSLRQNESIILFCKDLLNLCKKKNNKNSYECIIRGLEKINKDNQISKLDNNKLSTYINNSMEKIIEEKNKNINIKKNKGDKYTHNIGVINNKFINKPKDKIIIDANNIGKIKIDNNTNNTNKLQQYKKIFNGTSTSIVYNKMKTNKNEEVKNITKYTDKNNKMKNENKSKMEDKSFSNEKNESIKSNKLLSKDEINKLKNNLAKSVKPPKSTIIALVDASKYMKDFIKDLVNNLLYNLLKKLNYDEKEKIYLLGYNTEDVEEMFIPISKLCKVDIETEGERDISEVLNKVYEILKNNNGRNFKILFFTSGNLYKQNLSLSKSKLFLYENETQKIRIQVIKYIINEQSIFDKDDENIFDMLNSINSKIKNKTLTIDGKNSISDNIDKIIKKIIN